MAQRIPTVTETATALLRVRRTRRAGSHRPQSRGHRRVHRRHGGIRSDLPEREKGFVQMENEGSGTLLRAQFRRTPVHISVGDEMGTVHEIFQDDADVVQFGTTQGTRCHPSQIAGRREVVCILGRRTHCVHTSECGRCPHDHEGSDALTRARKSDVEPLCGKAISICQQIARVSECWIAGVRHPTARCQVH